MRVKKPFVSIRVRKPAIERKPFDVLLAEPKFLEFHASLCSDHSDSQVAEDVVVRSRARELGAKSLVPENVDRDRQRPLSDCRQGLRIVSSYVVPISRYQRSPVISIESRYRNGPRDLDGFVGNVRDV
jgi:hypothetical protein